MNRLQEKDIKTGLNEIADQVIFTEQQEMKNLSEIHQRLNRRKQFSMMGKGKKILIAAAAITALCATTAIGAGKIVGWYSGSNSNDSHYATAQDIKNAKDILGVIPKAPEQFSNGLKYENGSHHTVEGMDESGTKVTSYMEVTARYSDSMNLTIRKTMAEDQYVSDPVQTSEINGIEVTAHEDVYLFLPPDAEPSADDKQLEEQGKLYISYGSSEEERQTFRYATWVDDGLRYMLNTFSDNYDAADMLQMSKEVIESR